MPRPALPARFKDELHDLSQHPALHQRPVARRRQRQDPGRLQPRHWPGDRPRGPCRHCRPGRGAGRCAKGLRDLARHARHRAQQDHAPRRRPDARARRRHRPAVDAGAGQAAGGGQGRDPGRRRHHRLVCRRRPARLRPHRAFALQPGGAPDGAERPGRPGGGVHAVELPRQPGGSQAGRGAGLWLLDDRQGRRGNPGLAGRADPRLRRRGPAAAACWAWCTATRPRSPAT